MKRTISAALVVTFVAGCATVPPPAATSTALYMPFNCEYLTVEAARTDQGINTALGAKLAKDSVNGVAVVAGMLLFWPALFLIQSTAAEDAQILKLTSDADAIRAVAAIKGCPVAAAPAAPVAPVLPPPGPAEVKPGCLITGC